MPPNSSLNGGATKHGANACGVPRSASRRVRLVVARDGRRAAVAGDPLAAGVVAIEVGEDPEPRGAALLDDVAVGRQVTVAAVLGQAVGVDRQRLLGDVAELLEGVPGSRLPGLRRKLARQPDRRVGEEVGDVGAVVVEPGDDRGQVGQERVEVARAPAAARARKAARAGKPRFEALVRSSRSMNSDSQVRRELANAAQGRADVVGHRQELSDQRPGVRPGTRRAAPASAGSRARTSADLEGLAQRLVLGCERLEGRVRAGDRAGELPVALARGRRRRCRCRGPGPAARACWRRSTSSMFEASPRNGPRLPSASLRSRLRPLIAIAAPCCHCWNAFRVSLSSALKISSIWVASWVCASAERPALGDRLRRPGVRALGSLGGGSERDRRRGLPGLLPERQLDVGLAEQRLLAQDRPGVAGDRRELGFDLDLRLGRVLAVDPLVDRRQLDRLDLADRDAADPHVRLGGELGRLREVGGDPVALGLQRDRPAEETQRKRISPKHDSARVPEPSCCCSTAATPGRSGRGSTHRAEGAVDVGDWLGGSGCAVIMASSALEYAFEGSDLASRQPPGHDTVGVDAQQRAGQGTHHGEADRDLDGHASSTSSTATSTTRSRGPTRTRTPERRVPRSRATWWWRAAVGP